MRKKLMIVIIICCSIFLTGCECKHSKTEVVNAAAATCVQVGYSGDTVCVKCNEVVESGEQVSRTEHEYTDHVCVNCSARESGLYADDTFTSWGDLENSKKIGSVKNEYIEIATGKSFYKYNFSVLDKTIAGTLVVRDTVSEFASKCFADCKSLEEVYLPDSVSETGNGCFGNCESLKFVYLPDSITDITALSFENCISLEQIELPSSLTSIGNSAFAGASNLERIIIPASVTEIGSYAFRGTTSLKDIVLNEGLTEIGAYAFENSGVEEIVVPSTVTELSLAFVDAHNLQTLDLSKTCITSCANIIGGDLGNLTMLILPNTAVDLSEETLLNTAIVELKLPQGFEKIYSSRWSSDKLPETLEVLYWPSSYQDLNGVVRESNVRTIYFEGSENEWKMNFENADTKDINVIYDYQY